MTIHAPSAGRDALARMRKAAHVVSAGAADRTVPAKLPGLLAPPAPRMARPRHAPVGSRGRRPSGRRRLKPRPKLRPSRAPHPLNGRSRRRILLPGLSVPPLRSVSRLPVSVLLPSVHVRSRRRTHRLARRGLPLVRRRLQQQRRNSAPRRARRVLQRPVDRAGTTGEHPINSAPRRHRLPPLSPRPRHARLLRHPLRRKRSLARCPHRLRPHLPHHRHGQAQRRPPLLRRRQVRHSRSIPPVCGSTICATSAGNVVKAIA